MMRMRMDGAARLPAAPLINHEEGGQVRLLASSLLLLEAQQSAAPPPPPLAICTRVYFKRCRRRGC